MSSLEHHIDELAARRVSRTLGNEADELLAASNPAEMELVARKVKLTALDIRRMLMDPSPMAGAAQSTRSSADRELRRMEVADLAVNVVAAVNYLLSILTASANRFPQLTLASNTSSSYGQDSFADAAFDQQIRQRLDARGTAVRLIMRLFAALRSDFVDLE